MVKNDWNYDRNSTNGLVDRNALRRKQILLCALRVDCLLGKLAAWYHVDSVIFPWPYRCEQYQGNYNFEILSGFLCRLIILKTIVSHFNANVSSTPFASQVQGFARIWWQPIGRPARLNAEPMHRSGYLLSTPRQPYPVPCLRAYVHTLLGHHHFHKLLVIHLSIPVNICLPACRCAHEKSKHSASAE